MLCLDTHKLIIIVMTTIIVLLVIKNNLIKQEMYNNTSSEKICIIQYDDRKKLPENLQKLINFNKEYCKDKPYIDFIYMNYHDISPYWMKVKLVKNKLNELYQSKEKYKYVMWLIY